MKTLKTLLAGIAAIASPIAAFTQVTQSFDIVVVHNSNVIVQADQYETIYFTPAATDNSDPGEAGTLTDLPDTGNYASPFTITGSSDLRTILDAYPLVSGYKAITMGIATKNAATISITAVPDSINPSQGLSFVFLRQVSTGIVQSILNDTATFTVPANDDSFNMQTDFKLYVGTYTDKSVVNANCNGTPNGSVTVTNPGCSGWALDVYNGANNTLLLSSTIQNADTTIAGLAAGNYILVSHLDGLLIDSGAVAVTEPSPIVPAFSVSNTMPYTGAAVNFTNGTTGATDYYWDFGDGNSSTLSDASNAYAISGTYTVTLTAFNGVAGCQATATATVTVIDPPIISQYQYIGRGSGSGDPTATPVATAAPHDLTISAGNLRINVNSEKETIAGVQVFNLSGQLVSSEITAGQNSSLPVPQAGAYIIRVQYTNGSYTSRAMMINE